MTRQEVFNKVWEHAVTKNAPLCHEDGSSRCLYNGPNNNHCWIGAVLPEGQFGIDSEELNTSGTVTDLMVEFAGINYMFEGITVKFLLSLQRCHDGLVSAKINKTHTKEGYAYTDKEYVLRDFARRFHVKVPVR